MEQSGGSSGGCSRKALQLRRALKSLPRKAQERRQPCDERELAHQTRCCDVETEQHRKSKVCHVDGSTKRQSYLSENLSHSSASEEREEQATHKSKNELKFLRENIVGSPVAATFWVNASRLIPPLTIGTVKNPSILVLFLNKKKEKFFFLKKKARKKKKKKQ